jgi:periplasmic protein CpxP/Spy
MEKLKFYKMVILVLVVINLLTIGTVWFVKPKGPRPMPHERDMTFLSKELGMTGANKMTLDVLETQHHTEKRELLGKNKALRESMFSLLKNNITDSIKINQYVDSILTNQKEIELMTYYHFNKVKTLCTPEQQLKLEETIAEAIRMAGGKPPKK